MNQLAFFVLRIGTEWSLDLCGNSFGFKNQWTFQSSRANWSYLFYDVKGFNKTTAFSPLFSCFLAPPGSPRFTYVNHFSRKRKGGCCGSGTIAELLGTWQKLLQVMFQIDDSSKIPFSPFPVWQTGWLARCRPLIIATPKNHFLLTFR